MSLKSVCGCRARAGRGAAQAPGVWRGILARDGVERAAEPPLLPRVSSLFSQLKPCYDQPLLEHLKPVLGSPQSRFPFLAFGGRGACWERNTSLGFDGTGFPAWNSQLETELVPRSLWASFCNACCGPGARWYGHSKSQGRG